MQARKWVVLTFAMLLLAGTTAAFGDDITWYEDPSTLHVGPGYGTACQSGCAGDPNLVPTTQLDIFEQSGGQNITASQTNPILLILGIPGDATSRFGSTNPISSVSFYNPVSGGSQTGQSAFAPNVFGLGSLTNGFKPGFNAAATGNNDIYSFLNLGGKGCCSSSNSFTNWANTDASRLGIHASTFGIYVFALYLNNANAATDILSGNGEIDINWASALPAGTYAVAFGANASSNGNKAPTYQGFSTPFTEAGQTGQVPEPGSMILLGSGLLGVAGLLRRRRIR